MDKEGRSGGTLALTTMRNFLSSYATYDPSVRAPNRKFGTEHDPVSMQFAGDWQVNCHFLRLSTALPCVNGGPHRHRLLPGTNFLAARVPTCQLFRF